MTRWLFLPVSVGAACLVGLAVATTTRAQPRVSRAPATQATAAPRVALRPCDLPNTVGAMCGTYEVAENRATRTGRTIPLRIVVLPALSAAPAPDPLFWLQGGPGAPATEVARAAKGGYLERIRASRDVVLVDQRGTGGSNPLTCDIGDDPRDLQAFFGELFPRDKVRACRDRLAASADVRLYTTSIAMDDLDEVRDALGYRVINIGATSYGTIAAQVYLRQHPDHVRAVFLLGVATPGVKQPLLFARAAQRALDRLFEDCAADATCHAAFPELRAEFEAVMARFDRGAQPAALINLIDGQPQIVQISRDSFVERLRLLLYTTAAARFVPFVVHRAFENDFLPFESVSIVNNPGARLARGMYLTVTCSEGIPFISASDIVQQSKGTFVGDHRVRAHMRACLDWPAGSVPRRFIDPIKSDTPVLMISGELDGSTPPWFGEEAVRYLSHGRQVKVPNYGHQIDSPCVWGIFDRFISAGSVDGVDTSCTDAIRRPPFATELPSQFPLRQRGLESRSGGRS